MLSLRGPLCAGEAFSLRPRGRGGIVSRGETWGPGRNSCLVPSPHISPLCWLRQKGGPLFHGRGILSCALITAVTLGTCGSKEA